MKHGEDEDVTVTSGRRRGVFVVGGLRISRKRRSGSRERMSGSRDARIGKGLAITM